MPKKVVVIGAGPGGYPAALKLAALGADVTLIERSKAGGVCLNIGCIPTKSLLDSAHRIYDLNLLQTISAVQLHGSYDFGKIQTRRQQTVDKLQQGLLGMFKRAGVNYVEGEAVFTSPSAISVNGQNIDFDAAIIAAGTKAFYPPPFDKYKDKLLDNSNIFALQQVPEKLAIIGGGVIGCEFACIFNAFGSKVTIVEMQPNILPMEDEACVRLLKIALEKRGVEIKTGRAAKGIAFDDGIKNITLDDGGTLSANEVLVAVGREMDYSALNLQAAGVEFGRKGIKVDSRTMHAGGNIYAAGDITGLCLLAHAAHAQGEVAAKNIMGVEARYNNDLIPKAVYTWPEIASIGLDKAQAAAKGVEVKIYKSFFLANGRALTQNAAEGFVQLVADAKTGKLLGAQIAGAGASEMIHTPLVAIASGMSVEDFQNLVFAHPTMSEAFKDALGK